jgi:hypothetical protein
MAENVTKSLVYVTNEVDLWFPGGVTLLSVYLKIYRYIDLLNKH